METPRRISRNEAIKKLAAAGVQLPTIARTYGLQPDYVSRIVAGPRRNSPDLEGRLQTVYGFILSYMTAHHGLPPSIREIAEGTQIKASSLIFFYLRKLEERGQIAFTGQSGARNFYLPGAIWTPPQ